MEQSPSLEADSHSASQELPHQVWSLKVKNHFTTAQVFLRNRDDSSRYEGELRIY